MKWFDDVKKYFVYCASIKRFIVPILVLYMVDQGLTIEQIAFIAALSATLQIILEVPSGSIADTIGHKRSLIIAVIGQAIAMVLYLSGTFDWILIASIIYWGSGTLISGTRPALLYERLKELGKEDEFQKLEGQAKSFSHFVGIMFMLLASIAYLYQPWLPFAINIVQYFVAIFAIGLFTEAKQVNSVKEREGFMALFTNFDNAIRLIRKQPFLFWIIVFFGLNVGAEFAASEFEQVILTNVGLAVVYFGAFYAAKRIIVVLVAPNVYKMKKVITPTLLLMLLSSLTVLHFFMIPIINSPLAMVTVMLILGTFVYTVVEISTLDYVNQMITSGSRATTISMKALIMMIVKLIVIGLLGWLGTIMRFESGYAVIGIILLIAFSISSIFLIKSYKNSKVAKTLSRA